MATKVVEGSAWSVEGAAGALSSSTKLTLLNESRLSMTQLMFPVGSSQRILVIIIQNTGTFISAKFISVLLQEIKQLQKENIM